MPELLEAPQSNKFQLGNMSDSGNVCVHSFSHSSGSHFIAACDYTGSSRLWTQACLCVVTDAVRTSDTFVPPTFGLEIKRFRQLSLIDPMAPVCVTYTFYRLCEDILPGPHTSTGVFEGSEIRVLNT